MTGWRLTGFALNMLIPLGTFALVMLLIVPGPGRGIDIRYRDDWVYIWVLTNTQKDPSLPPDFELSWPLALVSQLVWAARLFQNRALDRPPRARQRSRRSCRHRGCGLDRNPRGRGLAVGLQTERFCFLRAKRYRSRHDPFRWRAMGSAQHQQRTTG